MGNADVLAEYLDLTIDVDFCLEDVPVTSCVISPEVLEPWRERISPCYILSLK